MSIARRLGRLFCCFALSLSAALSFAADPAKTIISDTLYRADGTPASGTLLISWPAFVTADGKPVAAGSMNLKIGPSGAINLPLVPTQGATPTGSYYKVVMKLDDGASSTEYWSVPTLSPTTLAAIRSSVVPASVALQVVSREYVDAADAIGVHKNGDESIAGVKTFVASPLVPEPSAVAAAANKGYVDAAVATGGQNILALNKGGTGNDTWTSARCVRVASDGSKLESAPADCGAAQLQPFTDPRAFGCVGNLVADDTACVQAAFNATPAFGAFLVPPNFKMRVTQTINLHNRNGILVFAESGQGNAADNVSPGFYWDGPDHGTLFSYNKSRGFRFLGVSFNAGIPGHSNTADVLLEIDQTVPNGGEANLVSDTLFDRCAFWTSGAHPVTAVYASRTALSNVEDIRFRDNIFGLFAAGSVGVHVGPSANAKNFEYLHNWFEGAADTTAIWHDNGSFKAERNYFATVTTNIRFDNCSDPVEIIGNLSEGDTQFVKGKCGYPSNQTITFRANNLDGNSNWINSALYRIELYGAAADQVILEDNHFDGDGVNHGYKVVGCTEPSNTVTLHLKGNIWPNIYLGQDTIWGDTIDGLTTCNAWMAEHAGGTMGWAKANSAAINSVNFAGVVAGYRRRAIGVVTNSGMPWTGEVNVSPVEPGTPAAYGSISLGEGEIEIDGVPAPGPAWATVTGGTGTTYHFEVVPLDASGNKAIRGGRTANVSAAAALDASNYITLHYFPVPGAASYDIVMYCGAPTSDYVLALNTSSTSPDITSSPCPGSAYTFAALNATGAGKMRFPQGLKFLHGGTITGRAGDTGSPQQWSIDNATGAAQFKNLTVNGSAPLTSADKEGAGNRIASVDSGVPDGCAQFAGGKLTSAGGACLAATPWVPAPATTHDHDTGIYANDVTVTVGGCSGGAKYVSTDGATVSAYGAPVSITATGATLKSRCLATGYDPSVVRSSTYTLTVATPADSPGAGTYSGAQTVTITSATTGAYICYTTDGSAPTGTGSSCTQGSHYTGGFSVASSATLKAKGFKADYGDSALLTSVYTIGGGSAGLTILNPSFEADNVGGCGGYSVGASSWTTVGSGVYTVRLCSDFPVPDGINSLQFNNTGAGVSQTLAGNYAASKTYTLTYYLCTRAGGGGGGVGAQLLYGANVLADTGAVTLPPQLTCQQHTLTYNSPGSGAMIGQPIVINLLGQEGVALANVDLVALTEQ